MEGLNMITIKFCIAYDNEYDYCVIVNENDKELATELVNKAYNEFLENDNISDFQEYASKLLSENGIEFEFSIWKE